MGNCQTVESTALIVQHPNGEIERMYRPIRAIEVMRSNPGHYVSLIIPLPMSGHGTGGRRKMMRYNRVKLLRPTDTLVLGHAYRLLTSQEVMRILRAKNLARRGTTGDAGSKDRKGNQIEEESVKENDEGSSEHERRLMTKSMNSRSKTWRPSLQSISEAIN